MGSKELQLYDTSADNNLNDVGSPILNKPVIDKYRVGRGGGRVGASRVAAKAGTDSENLVWNN